MQRNPWMFRMAGLVLGACVGYGATVVALDCIDYVPEYINAQPLEPDNFITPVEGAVAIQTEYEPARYSPGEPDAISVIYYDADGNRIGYEIYAGEPTDESAEGSNE